MIVSDQSYDRITSYTSHWVFGFLGWDRFCRHLAEFWMIEPELAFADIFDDMTLAEALFWQLFLRWWGCSLHATLADMERITWSTASNTPWCTTARTEFICYCDRLQGFLQLHSDTEWYTNVTVYIVVQFRWGTSHDFKLGSNPPRKGLGIFRWQGWERAGNSVLEGAVYSKFKKIML